MATSALIILGSGSSTGVPTPSCVIRPSDPPCDVCHMALQHPPEDNRNYRCNPSMVIKYQVPDSSHGFHYIQIDAGKCFKEQVLRWFVRHKIPNIDALVLTHEHADAILGLDDIRGVQPWDAYNRIPPMPVFLSQHSLDSIRVKFPYLAPPPGPTPPSPDPTVHVIRRVTQLSWNVVEPSVDSSFNAAGLDITPLPVKHGEDYTCLGFLFGSKERVAYLSDVSKIPAEVEHEISINGKGAVDILILDALFRENPHNTHICLPEVKLRFFAFNFIRGHLHQFYMSRIKQSLEIIKSFRPKKAFLIGMTHEFNHEVDNLYLREWSLREGLDVQLSFDGQIIPVDL